MWASLLEIIATVLRWFKGSAEGQADTRVRKLEDAATKERAQQLEDFDAQAADVHTADDAVELLKAATKRAEPN